MPQIIRFTCALDPIYGGVPRGVSMISRETASRGISTAIVSCGNSYISRKRSRFEVDLLKRSNIDLVLSHSLFSNPYGIGSFLKVAIFLSKLERPKLVVLHQIWSVSTLIGFAYARIVKAPFAIMPHGSLAPYHQYKSKNIKKLVTRTVMERILRNADHILVTSELERNELADELAKKSRLIPYGSDLIFPREVKKVEGRVIFAGRVTKKKNLDRVIMALPAISEEFPNVELIVAGDGTSAAMRDLQNLVIRIGLEKKVKFLGWLSREELISNLSNSQVFVLPSEYENFGHAVMESICCGTPVVISSKVALSDMVLRSKSGVVIEEITLTEISNAVRTILRDSDQYLRLTKIAAENEFDWGSITESWRNLIEN